MLMISDVTLILFWLCWWTCYRFILWYVVMTTHNICFMKKIFTYGLVSYLLCYVGYDASHDHCTCRLRIRSLASFLHVKLICTIKHEMLIWHCEIKSLTMTMLYVDCDPYLVYDLCYVHRRFPNHLAFF